MEDAETFEAPDPWKRILSILIDKESMGAENMVVGLGRFKPGQKCAAHSHEESEEAYFILEGKGVIVVGDEKYKVTKGDAIFVPKKFNHQVINNDEKEDLFFIWVMSPPGDVPETIRKFKRIK